MSNYKYIAKYYDVVMGDRNHTIEFLKEIVNIYSPLAESILEVACGTGEILLAFQDNYKIAGLDISKEMLHQAKEKFANANFYNEDMRSFHIDSTFDVIFCIFNSINHLTTIDDWQKFFDRSYAHLNSMGILIFDMYTIGKYKKLLKEKNDLHKIGNDYVNIQLTEKKGKYIWQIRIFENINEDKFLLKHETIESTSFPISRVKKVLIKSFKINSICDSSKKRLKKSSPKAYIICEKI